VVFIGDHIPPMKFPDPPARLKELGTMMDRGAGIVCIHYATGLRAEDVAEDGDHPLLRWAGGYFATKCKHHQSVAKVMTATIEPAKSPHDVLRGVKAFKLHDEPYYNNYFGQNGPAKNVTVLATAQVPPAAPKVETVAWAVERPDGGRGVSVVMPHFYRNWKDDDLRKLFLNAIVWTTKGTVPADGVSTQLPDLATFKPDALEPKPAKNAKP
jgi:type 1 glutamine amidotransferase